MATARHQMLALLAVLAATFVDSRLLFGRKSRATCPDVVTKPDFDYRPYAGLWYEIFRFENVFQSGSQCERAIYEEISPGVVSVVNTAVLSDGSQYNITGTATAISPDEPGHLIVSFPGRPNGTYLVLDTDYTNWSSVYSCTQAGIFALEYAWLLGRDQLLAQNYLITALSKFSQFGIDIGQFNPTMQGANCTYYPEYPFAL